MVGAPADPPGTNVRGGGSGASWRLLLPSPAPERTVILGPISAADRRALTDAGGSVAVIRRRWGWWHRRDVQTRGAVDRSRIEDGSADALIVIGTRGIRALRHPAVLREMKRVCSSETVVYVQHRGEDASDPVDLLARPIRERLRVGTTGGDLRWAAPAVDAAAVGAARTLGTTVGGGLRVRAGRIGHMIRAWIRPDPDVAELRSASEIGHPPRYLREVAAESEISLDGRRWAMTIPGLYTSNKALFLLFPETGSDPDLVIKVARTPSQTPRLERESTALRALSGTRWIEAGSAPRELFFGLHAGIAVLGETAVIGDPFRRRTTAEPGCMFAADAVERLIALGQETATAGSASQLGSRLLDLLERYRQLYRPTPRHTAFLRAQIARIGSADAVPRVFQHGDPGAWNIVVRADGTAAFLDWEAADPGGVPLWDLFYFLRSFAVTVSRAHGIDDALTGIRRALLEPSGLADVIAGATRRACGAIGIPNSLVGPLFATCWMHRAVKQAARLPRSRLRRGHYHRLLTITIDEWQSAGLRRLFADG